MKMKILITFVLIFTSLIFLVGCQETQSQNPETSSDTINIPSNDQQSSLESEIDIENNENNDKIDNVGYYTDAPLSIDPLIAIDTYIRSDLASSDLINTYDSADNIEALPVVGPYFESTKLVTYLFYEGSQVTQCLTLSIDENEIQEFSATTDDSVPFDDESCLYITRRIKEDHPDFQIMGYIYNTLGYPCIYPFGISEDDTAIKYALGTEPTEFRLVDPFSTIEEGRAAFASYLNERAEIKSQINIYPWENEDCGLGYIRVYEHEDVFKQGLKKEDIQYLSDYDNNIPVPLLGSNLEENKYVLHLLYYHNDLIAEIVLERKVESDGTISFVSAWQNIADKGDDGKYIPISRSKYETALRSVKAVQPDAELQGVIFEDSEFKPFIYENDTVKCFDSDKNDFIG